MICRFTVTAGLLLAFTCARALACPADWVVLVESEGQSNTVIFADPRTSTTRSIGLVDSAPSEVWALAGGGLAMHTSPDLYLIEEAGPAVTHTGALPGEDFAPVRLERDPPSAEIRLGGPLWGNNGNVSCQWYDLRDGAWKQLPPLSCPRM